jgi:uncharacterized protein (DUF697 family)
MALPIDVRDIYRFGRQITEDRDEPLSLAVLVELDTAPDLLDAAKDALRPRTANARVEVIVLEEGAAIPLAADAAIVLAGSASAAAREAVVELRRRLTPVCAVAVRPGLGALDYDLGLPLDDVLVGLEAKTLVEEDLAGWLADRLGSKRLALAVNLEFTRRAVAMEIVKTTALQNTLIGTVTILPGTDMPLMTANQAKMLLQLATAYGQRIGGDRLGELAAVVGGGFVFRSVARQALTAIPGFGWAIKGGVAYGGTMAMGRSAIAWFEQGADVNEIAARLKEMGSRRPAPSEIEATPVDDDGDGGVQQTLAIEPADDGS